MDDFQSCSVAAAEDVLRSVENYLKCGVVFSYHSCVWSQSRMLRLISRNDLKCSLMLSRHLTARSWPSLVRLVAAENMPPDQEAMIRYAA